MAMALNEIRSVDELTKFFEKYDIEVKREGIKIITIKVDEVERFSWDSKSFSIIFRTTNQKGIIDVIHFHNENGYSVELYNKKYQKVAGAKIYGEIVVDFRKNTNGYYVDLMLS